MSGINAASLWDQRVSAAQSAGVAQLASSNTPTVDKTEFLNLLVAQLKNQDPLNPVNSQDFVAQLATFSSLEQLIDINKAVTKLAAGGDQQTSNGTNSAKSTNSTLGS
jgi:flagellar basal-body rod modification protein FlgD